MFHIQLAPYQNNKKDKNAFELVSHGIHRVNADYHV